MPTVTYPEQVELMRQLKTQLSSITGTTIVIENDELELVRNRTIPFINIRMKNFRIANADNMDMHHMVRHYYDIVLTFAVSQTLREDAMTASTGSIWKLYGDIKTAIESDLTIGGLCNTVPFQSDSAVDCVTNLDGKKWIGRGYLTITFYKDFWV